MDTNQESKNSLDIYISELGEFYTLSRKQEKELLQTTQNGGIIKEMPPKTKIKR